jgi:2-iminobutanoate/2-iminopropanoate deaminase
MNMDDFGKINAVYASYFNEQTAPARETVQVACLPKNVNVEISMIAIDKRSCTKKPNSII